jgi:hypothetical protein
MGEERQRALNIGWTEKENIVIAKGATLLKKARRRP